MLSRIGDLLKNRKVQAGSVVAGLLGGAYLLGRSMDDKDTEDIQLNIQPTQPQPTQQTKPRKATAKPTTSQPQATQTQNKQQDTPTVGAFLPELLRLYQLSNQLALQYEEDAKAYYQVFQEYSEKLEKLIQFMSLNLSKTPLGMMTGFDLPDILENFLKYYPWEFVKQNFQSKQTRRLNQIHN
jgi:hypothetical protein